MKFSIILLVVGLGALGSASEGGSNGRAYVSLLQIVANPDDHVGRDVRTAGLLGVVEERRGGEPKYRFYLYLTTEYALYGWDGIEVDAHTAELEEFLKNWNHKRVVLNGRLERRMRTSELGVDVLLQCVSEVADRANPGLAIWKATEDGKGP